MAILFNCQCGKQLQVKEELAGKKVRCPACQAVLVVPQSLDEDEAPLVYAVQDEPRSARRPSNPGRRGAQNCHEIDYEIFGTELQLVEVELDPGETVVAEAGAMTYMEDGVEFEARMGDGSEPNQGFFGKLKSAGKRILTGESIFMTHFTNHASDKRRVAFGAPYPGKIIPWT